MCSETKAMSTREAEDVLYASLVKQSAGIHCDCGSTRVDLEPFTIKVDRAHTAARCGRYSTITLSGSDHGPSIAAVQWRTP